MWFFGLRLKYWWNKRIWWLSYWSLIGRDVSYEINGILYSETSNLWFWSAYNPKSEIVKSQWNSVKNKLLYFIDFPWLSERDISQVTPPKLLTLGNKSAMENIRPGLISELEEKEIVVELEVENIWKILRWSNDSIEAVLQQQEKMFMVTPKGNGLVIMMPHKKPDIPYQDKSKYWNTLRA